MDNYILSFDSKGQVSVEYLFVIAVALSMILVTAYAFFVQTKEASVDQQLATIDIMAYDILSNAKNVYYSGGLSKKTLRYAVPPIVQSILVSEDNAIVFAVSTEGSTHDLTYYSEVPIKGAFPETAEEIQQVTHFLIYSKEDYAFICTEEFGATACE